MSTTKLEPLSAQICFSTTTATVHLLRHQTPKTPLRATACETHTSPPLGHVAPLSPRSVTATVHVQPLSPQNALGFSLYSSPRINLIHLDFVQKATPLSNDTLLVVGCFLWRALHDNNYGASAKTPKLLHSISSQARS